MLKVMIGEMLQYSALSNIWNKFQIDLFFLPICVPIFFILILIIKRNEKLIPRHIVRRIVTLSLQLLMSIFAQKK